MKRWVTSLFILVSFEIIAQINVPRDTSYTVQSTLSKQQKYYPDVTIPGVNTEGVRVDNDIVYRDLNGRSLLLDVYYSDQPTNVPGIVLVHGGGWRAGDKTLMRDMAIRLVQKGFVVTTPEYRMSLESPFPSAVYDIKASIRWFKANAENYGMDSGQVAIVGCSAGGQLATLVGVTYAKSAFYEPQDETSSEVRAIIDVDGVLKFRHPDSSEGSMAAAWLGGSYEQVPENWEQASPLNFVDENTPPTLFLASKYPRFLAGHREYMDILNANRILVNKVEMGDAPHSFWLLNPWFEPTVDHIVNFLNTVFEG